MSDSHRNLRVAISPDLPPFVLNHATSGIEVELTQRLLAGYTLQFIQMPLHEVETAIAQKRAEVAVCVQKFRDDAVHYSDDFVGFENVAIAKKAGALKINRIADLADHTVLAWQDAYLELGPEFKGLFAEGSSRRTNYLEIGDQREQVQRFWQAAADIIVIDRSAFAFFSAEMGHSMNEVVVHSIFPPQTVFKVGFTDATLRDAFNQSLSKIRESGEYAKLLDRYQHPGS